MLLVKTYIAPSTIQGMGLFAGENIKKGTMIWRFQTDFDRAFTVDQLAKLPPLLKEFVETYAVLSTESSFWVLGNDDVRFTNHSTNGNAVAIKIPEETELVSVAGRDISKGEEITVNYKTIDAGSAISDEGYLSS